MLTPILISLIVFLLVLIFILAGLLITIIIIGGAIMDAINQAIANLNAQIASLQGRLGGGVIVSQADLANVANSINQAATTISSIAA